MKLALNLLCLLSLFGMGAQNTNSLNPEHKPQTPAPYFSYKNGLGFTTPDSSYSMNIRFRMQNRMGVNTQSDEDLSPESFEFRVRRCRLSFTGHVYNPKLTYYLQLSFSRGDMDWDVNDATKINTSVNAVRDAIVYYKPNANLQIGIGQTKLPGNRQRVISSGAQQFYDRSVVNALYTLDRDMGFFATYKLNFGPQFITLFKGAITSGEGRNTTNSNSGLAYTGRVEFLPLGAFTDGGDYYEGDLAREIKPKLSVGGAYHLNDMAVRTQGELGKDLYEARSFETYIADLVFKYRGVSLSSEYLMRSSTNPLTYNSQGQKRALVVGDGINTQLSYCSKSMWEVAGRYTLARPDKSVYSIQNQIQQYGIGLTKYIMKHKVKVQGNLFYNHEKNLQSGLELNKYYTAVVQVELGI
jgi:phosphate-selective porin OprO/OprP